MLDFATYDLGYDPCTFFDLFINSGLAKRFEKGEFNVTVGMSGVELAYRVLELTGHQVEDPQPRYSADRSPEYWAGWALAYYQWETAMSFLDILEFIPLDDIIRMYAPYHEMDIRQFCDRMNELYRKANPETKLKQLRQRAGLSQSELAEQSGVPVRTIQQYEQRQKSINKAQAEYLIMLANALHCNAEDLIETVE
jgi:DNA-binding transcriptional regulator YiaG